MVTYPNSNKWGIFSVAHTPIGNGLHLLMWVYVCVCVCEHMYCTLAHVRQPLCHFTSELGNSPSIRQWEAHQPSSHSCLITTQTTAHIVQGVCAYAWLCVRLCMFLCAFGSGCVRLSICVVSSVLVVHVPSLLSYTLPYGRPQERSTT